MLPNNKKALSEIISYTLLIIIALALALLVYLFLKNYIPTESASCPDDVGLIIKDYSCSTSDHLLSLTLENRGLFNADAAYIKIGTPNQKIRSNLNKGGSIRESIKPGETLNYIYGISPLIVQTPGEYVLEVQPAIKENKRTIACTKSTITQPINCNAAPFSSLDSITLTNPSNQATNVLTSEQLRWDYPGAIGNINYIVSIGTENEETISPIETITTQYYNPQKQFDSTTKYFWQILAENSEGKIIAASSTWAFTTGQGACNNGDTELCPGGIRTCTNGVMGACVANNPPVLETIGNKDGITGNPLTFTISATDIDNDFLTYSATNLPTGATINAATGTFNWDLPVAGTYTITFSVNDGKGGTDSETITILVITNNPPVLAAIGGKTVLAGAELTFTISATDLDNDPLTYSATNLPTGAFFNADTRTFGWGGLVEGNYEITFSVNDGKGGIDSETIVLSVVANNAPVLDTIGNKQGSTANLLTFTVSATDPDIGDTLTYYATNLPTGATFNPATRTFNWASPIAGAYTTTFGVNDQWGRGDLETISINIATSVINYAPVLAAIGDKTGNSITPLTFTISATDANGNVLTYSATNLPTGATINAATGTFNWDSPVAGTYTITFSVNDGKGGTDSETITITINYAIAGLLASWHFDETGGLNTGDSSGNGYTLSLFNNPTRVSGSNAKRGYALQFSGSNYARSIYTIPTVTDTNGFTFNAWVMRKAGGTQVIVDNGKFMLRTGLTSEYTSHPDTTPFEGFVHDNYLRWDPRAVDITMWPNINQWYFVSLSWDGKTLGNLKIYVDGNLKATTSRKIIFPNCPTCMFYIGFGTYGSFNGIIDEVSLYNKALTLNEIQNIYNDLAVVP